MDPVNVLTTWRDNHDQTILGKADRWGKKAFISYEDKSHWKIVELNLFQRFCRFVFGCYKETHGKNIATHLSIADFTNIKEFIVKRSVKEDSEDLEAQKREGWNALFDRLEKVKTRYAAFLLPEQALQPKPEIPVKKVEQAQDQPEIVTPDPLPKPSETPIQTLAKTLENRELGKQLLSNDSPSAAVYWISTLFKVKLSQADTEKCCQIIDELVKKGVNLNMTEGQGVNSCLLNNIIFLMSYLHMPILNKVLEHGAKGMAELTKDPNVRNGLLYLALQNKSVHELQTQKRGDLLKLLIDHAKAGGGEPIGYELMQYATFVNLLDVVKLFVEYGGADPNCKNKNNTSLLQETRKEWGDQRRDIIDFLDSKILFLGAQLYRDDKILAEAKEAITNNNFDKFDKERLIFSLFYHELNQNEIESWKQMLDKMLKVEASNQKNNKPYFDLNKCPRTLEIESTLLDDIIKAPFVHWQLLEVLLNNGAKSIKDLSDSHSYKSGLLYQALNSNLARPKDLKDKELEQFVENRRRVFLLLLDHTKGQEGRFGKEGDDTVLHLAANLEAADLMELFLKEGANPKLKDKHKSTALHNAAEVGIEPEKIPSFITYDLLPVPDIKNNLLHDHDALNNTPLLIYRDIEMEERINQMRNAARAKLKTG